VKIPLEWVWQNDPEGLPDDDHARCIAAPGERLLVCGAHQFALTTRPCLHLSDPRDGCDAGSFSTLYLEYRGFEWARGLAQGSWGSDRFASHSRDGQAQQAAGLALFAALSGALAAGSVVHRRSAAPVHFEAGTLGQSVGRSGHGSRRPRPALLPLKVGRAGASPQER
jgi:hypothetical protein